MKPRHGQALGERRWTLEERERLDFRIKELRAYSEFYRTIVIDYEWRKANPRYARFPKFFRF